MASDDEFLGEVLSALDHGVELELYLALRSLGLTDIDVADLRSERVDLAAYLSAHRAGASNEEVREVVALELDLWEYTERREYGTSHEAVLEAAEYADASVLVRRHFRRPYA